jgi:hypothetical protein
MSSEDIRGLLIRKADRFSGNGSSTPISGQPFANTETRQFTPLGNNHDGDSDWVLVLDASK